jgi:CelD/BcsL family acetyltransferase involved in cellulose biosynthesis
VTYREFNKQTDVASFLKAMLQIERNSWKETVGTSVTKNDYQKKLYEELTDIMVEKHCFTGHTLELNGKPIAYVYGLLFNGTFSDLKESFDSSYHAYSPGQVLKTFILQRLIEDNVRYYDYMGVCEPYKMRWTKDTYARSNYVIYNGNLGGLAARFSSGIGRLWTRCRFRPENPRRTSK